MKLGEMPAFPQESSGTPGPMNWSPGHTGMTLRQYYAGLALQAWIYAREGGIEYTVEKSVEYADALLAALEGK